MCMHVNISLPLVKCMIKWASVNARRQYNDTQIGIRNCLDQNVEFSFHKKYPGFASMTCLLVAEPIISAKRTNLWWRRKRSAACPHRPRLFVKGRNEIFHMFSLSVTGLLKAILVSLLRDWIRLLMCNQANVKMAMAKTSQTFFFFFFKKATQGRKCKLDLNHSNNLNGSWALRPSSATVLAYESFQSRA